MEALAVVVVQIDSLLLGLTGPLVPAVVEMEEHLDQVAQPILLRVAQD
jgi:hypothetical protein